MAYAGTLKMNIHIQKEVFLIYFYNLYLRLSLDMIYKCLKN